MFSHIQLDIVTWIVFYIHILRVKHTILPKTLSRVLPDLGQAIPLEPHFLIRKMVLY